LLPSFPAKAKARTDPPVGDDDDDEKERKNARLLRKSFVGATGLIALPLQSWRQSTDDLTVAFVRLRAMVPGNFRVSFPFPLASSSMADFDFLADVCP